MVPYFPPQVWHLGPWHLFGITIGPIPLHLFGLLVAVGILVGSEIAVRRAAKIGESKEVYSSLTLTVVITGFIGAHLAAVFFYDLDTLKKNPLFIFQIWNGISSLGGFLGAFAGLWWFVKKKGLDMWTAMDVIAYALPFGWLFGRMGCASVHDHPGIKSDFFLAVKFPGGPRHDLGFYEMLFTLVIVIFFATQWNKERPKGFFLVCLLVLYPPVRFFFDFLRIADATYMGLTFAQWVLIPLFFIGLRMAYKMKKGELNT